MVAIPAEIAVETAPVATETVAAPPAKKEKAPRVRKAAAPKAKEEKAPAAPSKTGTAPKTKEHKKGLRKPQARILTALAKSKVALSRTEIAKKAGVDQAYCTSWIGSTNETIRKTNDAKYFLSLVSLGLVKIEHHEANEGGRDVVRYSITAKGRIAAAK